MSSNNMSGKAEMYFWSSNRSTTSSNDAAGLRPTERAYPTLKSSSASQPSTATALPAPSLAVDKTSYTMMDSTLSLAENSNNDSNRSTSVDKPQKQPHPQPHQQHKPPPPPHQQQQPRVFASTLENHNPVSKLQHSSKKSKHNIKRPATAYNKSSGGEEEEAGEATSLAVVAGNAATSSSTTATMTQAEQRPFKRIKPNRACPSSVGAVASTDSSNNGNHHHQHHVVDVQDDTHWDEYYYQLCLFKVVEGHLLVPHDYVCTDDYFGGQNGMEFRVGEWVQRQRFELSPYVQAENEQGAAVPEHMKLHIRKLQDIGFEFDDGWEDHYVALVFFKAIQGHTDVAVEYISNHGKEPLALGKWTTQQRSELSVLLQGAKKKELLHAYIQRRIEKLEEIGFEWNDSPGDQQVARLEPQQSLSSKPQGLDWEDFYALLPAYKAKYNTLAIPVKYETPEGVRIGAWATRQRSFYNRTLRGEKSMSKKRIAKLNAIDFPWGQKKKFGWQDYYQLVLDFKAEYHHLRIPCSYETPDGIRLGDWARNQRALYANKLRMETSVQVAKDDSHSSTSQHPRIDLLNARFELLNSISFLWKLSR